MSIRFFTLLLVVVCSTKALAQEKYKFSKVIDLDATDVISQGRTGTCWSFSATSFLESEIIRISGKTIDLSEMYNVRNTYSAKAENYIMRQGKAQFSQGGLAHDVFNSIIKHGIVPNSAYSGITNDEPKHNHSELEAVINAMLTTYIKNPGKSLSEKWKPAIEAVLDIYLGGKIEKFNFEGKEYTPQSFLSYTKIKPEDYISITSFSHKKFYDSFILNIPDNFSNGIFYNVPLDEFISLIDDALENGFSVELDCDVTEPTFSSKSGVAFIPANPEDNKKGLSEMVQEMKVSQIYKQKEFENYNTTDDHLMHITGTAEDQNGTKYYQVKNSWGAKGKSVTNGGYIYMSESYMRLKSISITLHKDALPNGLTKQLKLQP